MTSRDLPIEETIGHWTGIVDASLRTQVQLTNRVAQTGVPKDWFGVLHLLLLASEHRMPMTRLARDLSMTAGGFTKLADRMGREGLIDRRGSSGDRRVVFATLTAKGLAEAGKAEVAYHEAVRELVLSILSPAEVEMVATTMRRLGEAIKPHVVEEPTDGLMGLPKKPVRDPGRPERRSRDREPHQADDTD